MSISLTNIEKSARRMLASCVACTLVAHADAQFQETFVLSGAQYAKFAALSPVAEPDWNCLDVALPEASIAAIMPNDQSGDPERITAMLQQLQGLVAETVLASTGPIGAAYLDGSLAAVEFDIFPANPVLDPSTTLPLVGVIQSPDGELLGTMHCFSAEQYALRQDFFEQFMGTPLKSYELWLGHVLQSSASGSRSLRVSGSSNTVYGDLMTNGTLHVEGFANVIPDFLTYAIGYVLNGSEHELGPVEPAVTGLLPTPQSSAAAYVEMATQSHTSFAGSITIVRAAGGGFATSQGASIPDGSVVHATGDVYVGSDDLVGRLTIISGGSIVFSTSGCEISGAVDGLLAWSASGSESHTVSISGNRNILRGASYSDGEFEVLGSENEITGRACGFAVTVGGSENKINDGTR